MTQESALAPYRVIELPGSDAALCGKILADLGADVIKVEPPGGDTTRAREPFDIKAERPESLFWKAYHRGKRGVTLDLALPEGKELLWKLIAMADFLVESYRPGVLADMGFGWEALHARHPALILVSVTPFGQTGPYSQHRGPDLVAAAGGGYMSMTGDKEHAPVRVSTPQAFNHGGGAGAAGALLALTQRRRTGKGQHVDAAAQHTYLSAMAQPYALWDFEGTLVGREGVWRDRGVEGLVRMVFPCKDGHVVWRIRTGRLGGPAMHKLVDRAAAEGLDVSAFEGIQWAELGLEGLTAEQLDKGQEVFMAYFKTKTKAELFQLDAELGIMLAPVYNVKDIMEDEQLRFRQFFETAPGDDPRIRYPGPALRPTETPLVHGAVAPRPGQHNAEVFGGLLGLAAPDLARLREAGCI